MDSFSVREDRYRGEENYYCSEELVAALEFIVTHYNHERYHESLGNVTPADVYYERQEEIFKYRKRVKKQSIKRRTQSYLCSKIT
ncbi:MAG: integrase core domain-containing protein [Chitinophagaceae bacterium]